MNPFFYRAEEIVRQIPQVDFHIHSDFTDGLLSIAEIVDRAKILGLEAIAFTDHARRTSRYMYEYFERIEEARQIFPEMKILKGLEVKIVNLSGELDLPEEAIPKLDLIVGVIHRFPMHRRDSLFASTSHISPEMAVDFECEASLAMIENRHGHALVLGHPGRTFIEQYNQQFPDMAMKELIEAASHKGVAIELNARSANLDQVFKFCLSSNCNVSLGSDAHTIDEIGRIVNILSQVIHK